MTDKKNAPFKDFDAVEREIHDVPVEFVVGGEKFTANMNLNAGDTLVWMRNAADLSATPRLVEMVLGEKEFARLVKTLQASKLDASFLLELVEYLGEFMELGGSGN
jgi:hypothetical protein